MNMMINNMFSCLCLSAVVPFLMSVQNTEAQSVFVVGDATGWTTPQDSSTYQSWASDNTFAVGDILIFNFQTTQHNVVQVSEESYTSCTSSNPIGTVYNTGPVNVTLNRTGQHYYICSIGQHCTRGQKLAINVLASAVPPSTATPPPPPPPPMSLASTFSPSPIPFIFICSLVFVFFYAHY
ncbi:hypothetical protein PHAVU_010G155900 [Phaseolus vulgaris]|uniref:Phytocyanin domain-containing protein n=1 Tax=Phaseolus vulgaris TaxID=3885 RepID=V7AQC3_PHAVU|nr:hypothetical protein PHAVU_010G155900g [Phaseolus vulgaris]ESW07749.1 hypothetical protein PHAVU_010G155900g [Phaseolus vulgaris]